MTLDQFQLKKRLTQLKTHLDYMRKENLIGASPRTIFIAFSGGAQPSAENAIVLGHKASLISLDGPLAEPDLSNVKSFIRIRSSFVGDLYDVRKLPIDTRVINFPTTENYSTMMKLDSHTDLVGKETNRTIIRSLVMETATKGLTIRTDELRFTRK